MLKNLANYYLVTANCSGTFALLFWSSMSLSRAILENLNVLSPVPAGINLPTITFSFKPWSTSILPLIAASVRTLVVSWNEAAEINDLVCNEAFVIPSNTGSTFAGALPSETNFLFNFQFLKNPHFLYL